MSDFQADLDAIETIAAVPTILNVVCRVTGMGFAAVARVTEHRWVCLAVNDEINFGLKPGGELKVETTICHEVRDAREAVIIDHAAQDAVYCGHPTPEMYGFQSYISMPIFLKDGSFFGTLCAIDPKPAKLKNEGVIGMFRLFAELIAFHLDAGRRLATAEANLLDARTAAEVRDQFIAVLGHDLRNPLASIGAGTLLLQKTPLDDKARSIVALMEQSVVRMAALISNILDFARGRLGGGLTLERSDTPLEPVLKQIIAELQAVHPGRAVEAEFHLTQPVVARQQPHRAAVFESCRQCPDIWCRWRTGPRQGHDKRPVCAGGLQQGRADIPRHDGATVSAIRPRRRPTRAAGPRSRPLYRIRDCAGPRRDNRGHVIGRRDMFHILDAT
jgi:GAF domain-containing protein